jgi:RNA polymerase sigma factor (sigma-70 family)
VAADSEQLLVDRAKRGEVEAFEDLLRPTIEAAYRYASALLRDSGLAEDAVQEASVRAWRKLSGFRSGSPFRPWFLGIVSRQCREQMRGKWWRMIRLPNPEVLSADLPEDAALRRVALLEALGELTEPEREILILRVYLDLSWSDAATAAGLTEAGARTRYYRALQRFRLTRPTKEAAT